MSPTCNCLVLWLALSVFACTSIWPTVCFHPLCHRNQFSTTMLCALVSPTCRCHLLVDFTHLQISPTALVDFTYLQISGFTHFRLLLAGPFSFDLRNIPNSKNEQMKMGTIRRCNTFQDDCAGPQPWTFETISAARVAVQNHSYMFTSVTHMNHVLHHFHNHGSMFTSGTVIFHARESCCTSFSTSMLCQFFAHSFMFCIAFVTMSAGIALSLCLQA